MSASLIRQVSPLASTVASELLVPFQKPTLKDAVLAGAFVLPRAALARVIDDQGGAWRLANVAVDRLGRRIETWYRPTGTRYWKLHPMLGIDRLETVPAPAGIMEATATTCNAQVLRIVGLAIECRRRVTLGDAIQAAQELAAAVGLRHALDEARA